MNDTYIKHKMNVSAKVKIFESLNSLYKIKANISKQFNADYSFLKSTGNVKSMSKFSLYGDDFKLPLLIKGRLITAGTYGDSKLGEFELTEGELIQTLNEWIGVEGYKHHGVFESVMLGEDIPIDGVAAKLVKTVWNDEDKGIDFFAEVYDADIAYKITNGIIKYVSAGFARDIKKTPQGKQLINLEPKEWSFVFKPRDINARIHPVI